MPRVIDVLLKAKGEPRRWLAEEVGIGTSELHKRMSGDIRFTAEEVAAIAQALDVEPGLLFLENPRDLLAHGERRATNNR